MVSNWASDKYGWTSQDTSSTSLNASNFNVDCDSSDFTSKLEC